MQDAGDNPFQDLSPPADLPIDPNTGVPIVNIGRGPSSAPTAGGGSEPITSPQETVTGPQGPQVAPQPLNATQTPSAPQGGAFSPEDTQALTDWITAKRGQAPTGEADINQPAPTAQDQAELAKAERQIMASHIAENMSMDAPFMNTAKAVNDDILHNVFAPLHGNAVANMAMGSVTPEQPAPIGDLQDAMEGLGTEYLTNPNKAEVDAQEMFNRVGLATGAAPDSYFTEGGHQVWNVLATALAAYYGAGAIAHRLAGDGGPAGDAAKAGYKRVVGLLAQKYEQAVNANPLHWLAGEVMGGIGATVGSEKAQNASALQGGNDLQQMLAGLSGGFVGGGVGGLGGAWITSKVGNTTVRLSKAVARQFVRALDGVETLFGHTAPVSNHFRESVGLKPQVPNVDPDIVENARAKETAARQAGEDVVEARKNLDANPTGQKNVDAKAQMQAAMDVEKARVAEAEKAWNMIPIEARGHTSYTMQAMRSNYADTVYPKTFSDEQVNGSINMFNHQIAEAMASIEPKDRTAGAAAVAAKLNKSLQQLQQQAKGVMAKYWKRVNLARQMPDRQDVLKTMDGIEKDFQTNYDPSQYPKGEIDEIRQRFAPFSPKPTLEYVRNKANALFEARNRALAEGKSQLARNYIRLYSSLMGAMTRAFPDDIPLAQARAESEKYFEFFKRSDISDLYALNRRGTKLVRPEETMDHLLRQADAFGDITKAVSYLQRQGVVNISDPAYMSKATKQAIANVQQDTETAVRQHFSDYIASHSQDPSAVAKYLGKPDIQTQFRTVGRVTAEMKTVSDQLKLLTQLRRAAETSALAKYMQADPDAAIDRIWNSSNGEREVTALINGEVGVGGMKGDPEAMAGLQAALLDKFDKSAGGKLDRMQDLLKGKQGRVLRAALGSSQFDRLGSIVNRIQQAQREAEVTKASYHKATIVVQMLSLKALHLVSELPGFDLLLHVGGGGSLQRAALVSGFAKDYMEAAWTKDTAGEMLHKALTNPEYEKALFSKLPTDGAKLRDGAATLRRVMSFERGIVGYYNTYKQYGAGPVAPGQPTDPDDGPLWFLRGLVPQAHAAEGENQGREQVPLYRGGTNVTPPTRPPPPVQPTPEGGPKGIHAEVTDTGTQGQRNRIETQRLHQRWQQDQKDNPGGKVPGYIGPGDRVPDRERGLGPGRRVIRVTEDGGKRTIHLSENYPNPFSDVGKYTPTPLTKPQEQSPALKFWEHPSPKRIPIREGSNPFEGATT